MSKSSYRDSDYKKNLVEDECIIEIFKSQGSRPELFLSRFIKEDEKIFYCEIDIVLDCGQIIKDYSINEKTLTIINELLDSKFPVS